MSHILLFGNNIIFDDFHALNRCIIKVIGWVPVKDHG